MINVGVGTSSEVVYLSLQQQLIFFKTARDFTDKKKCDQFCYSWMKNNKMKLKHNLKLPATPKIYGLLICVI